MLDKVGVHGWERLGPVADLIGIAFFAGLCFLLLRAARQRLDTETPAPDANAELRR
jgi:hypothetical protein